MIDQSLRARAGVPIHSDARVKWFHLIKLRLNDDFSPRVDEAPLSTIDYHAPFVQLTAEGHGSHSFGELLDAFKTRLDGYRTIFSDESPLPAENEDKLALYSSSWSSPDGGEAFRKIFNSGELRIDKESATRIDYPERVRNAGDRDPSLEAARAKEWRCATPSPSFFLAFRTFF